MWVVSCRAVGLLQKDTKEEALPEKIWIDAMVAFTGPQEMAVPWPSLRPINVWNDPPYSLSERPLCADTAWLFGSIFNGKLAFECSTDNKSISSEREIMNEEEKRSDDTDTDMIIKTDENISSYLSKLDCQSFISFIAHGPGHEEVAFALSSSASLVSGNSVSLPADDGKEIKPLTLLSPIWMANTEPQYILGECVVKIRCASEPLPDDPTPKFILPKVPIKIALWGISDKVRRAVAKSLNETYGLVIIRTSELVEIAFKLGSTLQEKISIEYTGLETISKHIYETLINGYSVDDDAYISLILEEILRVGSIPQTLGCILEDFPNSFEDARKLIEALSGIDYNSKKPNALDRASSFTCAHPTPFEGYDVKKCGLDALIFLESDADNLVTRRFGEREDLRTGETVYLTDELIDSIEFCGSKMKPHKPAEMYALGLTMAMNTSHKVSDFFEKLEILSMFCVDDYESVEDVANDVMKSLSDLIQQKTPLCDIQNTDTGSLTDDARIITVGNGSPNSVEDDNLSLSSSAQPIPVTEPIASTDQQLGTVISKPRLPTTYSIHKLLSDGLCRIWSISEDQSIHSINTFFTSLRSVRFQALQRRRALYDVLYTNLVVHDDRQSVFEDFRNGFNEIENDFRFDTDCIAELHLRTQELRHHLWSMSENRRKETENILKKFTYDGSCNLSIYHCQCEGVALIQSESNRFIAGMHVLLDLYYVSQNRSDKNIIISPIEETLPLPGTDLSATATMSKTKPKDPAKDKKTPLKPIKGKDTTNESVPRAPIGPIVITPEMADLPEFERVQEEEDEQLPEGKTTKGKAKAKANASKTKKAQDDHHGPPDLLSQIVTTVIETVDIWSKGTFTVNRALYGGDEEYCSALEHVVWYEVNRFKRTINAITQLVTEHSTWLTQKETEFIAYLKSCILERQQKELAVTERLIACIQEAITDNSPIRCEWQIAADVMVVKRGRLVHPAPTLPPVPDVLEFFNDRLNDEQLAAAQEMLRHMQMNKVVLEEDLIDWLKRAENSIGPFAFGTCDEGKFIGLTWPRNWRGPAFDDILQRIVTMKPVAGTDESVGGVAVESIITKLQSLHVEAGGI